MKMIIAIIGSEDADDLVYELNQHSFFVQAFHDGRLSEKEKYNPDARCRR